MIPHCKRGSSILHFTDFSMFVIDLIVVELAQAVGFTFEYKRNT
jgi:hypothetical protein